MIDPRGAILSVAWLGTLRAPGTWGSLPPPVAAVALLTAGTGTPTVSWLLVATGLCASAACLTLGRWAQRRYGAADPRPVVADEVAGQCVALLFLPWRTGAEHWTWNLAVAAVSFGAFRAADILKPQPARRAERLPGGWGILADDLVAGLYALGATQILTRLLGAW
jgi:phosphatidylglycerophosphatase A